MGVARHATRRGGRSSKKCGAQQGWGYRGFIRMVVVEGKGASLCTMGPSPVQSARACVRSAAKKT
eukprot:15558136-Heterocapsa_arctica.AAC.1